MYTFAPLTKILLMIVSWIWLFLAKVEPPSEETYKPFAVPIYTFDPFLAMLVVEVDPISMSEKEGELTFCQA